MPGKFTFFTTAITETGAAFDESEFGHAIRTLRYKTGDEIAFTDGMGHYFTGRISTLGKNSFEAEILSRHSNEPKPELTLIAGIIKSSDRMEWMVEKCTELGARAVYFVKTRNSERAAVNIPKLQKTATAALKQCHRSWLPEIQTIAWNDLMGLAGRRFIAAIPESGELRPLHLPVGTYSVLVGPEGDFTPEELDDAIRHGFEPVTLGSAVLRSETAVVAVAAYHALSRQS